MTVLVDDPANVSNGSMSPGPLLYMWPTPPNPRSMIGENRGWGEILAVHEFAHAAHLTRPSRNRMQRLISELMPVPVTRLMRQTPRWATEGYATYVEGRLTGSGRPHGVWRPAVLRTWALEGQLPTYAQMSSSEGFYGGAMAYLVGSAFLEWLVAREEGDESVLPDVWARFTARQERSFAAAFTGVFGDPPPHLYGLFTVDVTERALAVRDTIRAAGGVVDGEVFQRLSWYTGDPAVSPDGERLALVLRGRDSPSRVVVMSTTPDTLPTRVRERYEEVYERDPEDVAPVERWPRTQRAEAALWPTAGAAYDSPAWLPDGSGILVVRTELVENQRGRPDLFRWDWRTGEVRRITRGQAIREADPAPDGTWAAGLRCLNARCDIVRIDLTTGAVGILAGGHELSPWFRPRVSPDGRTIVANRQVDGRWELVTMHADGSNQRLLGPDDGADRFDAEFLPDGGRLVLTSTRGGIHNLELLDLEDGSARPLTRVLGAAVAPAPTPEGNVFFLSLHSRGWDLRRIATEAAPAVVHVDPRLAPAAAVGTAPADTFPPAPLGPIRGYGLGPRFRTLLPMGSAAVEAYSVGASIGSTDPIGRLSWQLQGLHGGESAWRGASLRALWRGSRPWIHLEAFALDGPLPVADGTPPPSDGFMDDPYYGGLLALELRGASVGRTRLLRLGGSAGRLAGGLQGGLQGEPQDGAGAAVTRLLGLGELHVALRQTPGAWRVGQRLSLHGSAGRTGGADWTRWLASASFDVGGRNRSLGLSGSLGGTDAPARSGELFGIGGAEPLIVDPGLLSQRIAMPALPPAFLRGDHVWTARAELRGFLPATAFYWTGDARGDGVDRYAVAGAEVALDAPAVPYVRLPAVQARFGVGRTLEEPQDNRWRLWAILGYRP